MLIICVLVSMLQGIAAAPSDLCNYSIKEHSNSLDNG